MLLKKSLTQAGVLISLIILVVLLLANWDKCFVNPFREWLRPAEKNNSKNNDLKDANIQVRKEGFQTDINTAVGKGVDARDIILELNPTTRQVKVGFTGIFGSDVPTDNIVRGYLLVMAKYDQNLNKVGTLDVKLTEETGGQTFPSDLKLYTTKYSGTLTQNRIDSINNIKIAGATAQSVLKSFLPSATTTPILADLNDLPTQEIGMYFELLELVYKYKMAETITLKEIYDELRVIFADLPEANKPITQTGDANYDYLQLSTSSTDKNKQAAIDLTRAINNFADLKKVLNPVADTNGKPKKIVVDALREFVLTLIKQIMSGEEISVSNICDPTTKKCGYTFTQVEPTDPQGNIYYYKLGIGVIFVNTITGEERISKIKAYTFGQGNKLQYFRVDTNLSDQERLLKRLEELERLSAQKSLQQQQVSTDSMPAVGSGINAYMNMLKPYIGNYPDEYILGTEQGRELTLDKYLNESLAAGQINIIADLGGLTPSTTAAAGRV